MRLNDQEEKILDLLVRHSGQDKSKVLKDALWDMFEDLRDARSSKTTKIGKTRKSRPGKT